MDLSATVRVDFVPRDPPRKPEAAMASGEVARALARRLRDDLRVDEAATTRALRASAVDDTIVVFGSDDVLPWVDGVVYLGRDDGAPLLFVPVHVKPTVPAFLIERSVLLRARGASLLPPFALREHPRTLFALGTPAPLAFALRRLPFDEVRA